MTNSTNVAVYTGVTNDLVKRINEHKSGADPDSFTAKYKVHKLVYYETYSDIYAAIKREKQIKSWNRARKNELVSSLNPEWKDLYEFVVYHF